MQWEHNKHFADLCGVGECSGWGADNIFINQVDAIHLYLIMYILLSMAGKVMTETPGTSSRSYSKSGNGYNIW